jgi:hypothetical protein
MSWIPLAVAGGVAALALAPVAARATGLVGPAEPAVNPRSGGNRSGPPAGVEPSEDSRDAEESCLKQYCKDKPLACAAAGVGVAGLQVAEVLSFFTLSPATKAGQTAIIGNLGARARARCNR